MTTSRRGYRSTDELEIREAVDAWGRSRWPDARVVHELVMNRGSVRADMAFVSPARLVSVEIKSGWDGVDRLMNQVAMFRLATPETWVVVDPRHDKDVALVRYLLPSIGVATAIREKEYSGPFRIEVVHEPEPFEPLPEAMLSLLWVAELRAEALRHSLIVPRAKSPSHASLVKVMLKLEPAEQLAAVCRQLRSRDALWRADAPVAERSA